MVLKWRFVFTFFPRERPLEKERERDADDDGEDDTTPAKRKRTMEEEAQTTKMRFESRRGLRKYVPYVVVFRC